MSSLVALALHLGRRVHGSRRGVAVDIQALTSLLFAFANVLIAPCTYTDGGIRGDVIDALPIDYVGALTSVELRVSDSRYCM